LDQKTIFKRKNISSISKEIILRKIERGKFEKSFFVIIKLPKKFFGAIFSSARNDKKNKILREELSLYLH